MYFQLLPVWQIVLERSLMVATTPRPVEIVKGVSLISIVLTTSAIVSCL